MRLVAAQLVSDPLPRVAAMEDRKRPATQEPDENGPPLKRQTTAAVNGASEGNEDMPYTLDVLKFQKEAIYRQMQEYSREKVDLEKQLKELKERSAHHNEHLRFVDAWWSQLLDDLKIAHGSEAKDVLPDVPAFPLEFYASRFEKYQEHFDQKSSHIKNTLNTLKSLSSAPPSDLSLQELQTRCTTLSAAERSLSIELERAKEEKEKLEERYAAVYSRAMIAEKKLDRAKSQTVAKIEKQAIHGGSNDAGSGLAGSDQKKQQSDKTNGVLDHGLLAEAETAKKEAQAVAEKQREQIEQLETKIESLNGEITSLNIRLSKISEDDIAKTDLFKSLKSQHEDVITKINHLEAANTTLREENEKLSAERTANRTQIEAETRAALVDMENALSRSDSDLTRVRTVRDELQAELAVRKSVQDQDLTASTHLKELLTASEQRIAALESEIERLKIQHGEVIIEPAENLDPDTLRTRYASLEKECGMLRLELTSMATAFRKSQGLASKKVVDLSGLEEKVLRLQAEKSKADQKYFAAMKAKETRDNELRAMKAHSAKSTEVVAQLKEVERANSQLVANLEKSLAEYRASETTISSQVRTLQQSTTEQKIVVDSLRAQISELGNVLSEKDRVVSTVSRAHRQAEAERERLAVRLEETKKSLDMWKSKGSENEEYESLRNLALCNVCKTNFKEGVIKTCGHVFCRSCIEERITSRSRKCPTCAKPFGSADYMAVHL